MTEGKIPVVKVGDNEISFKCRIKGCQLKGKGHYDHGRNSSKSENMENPDKL